MLKITEQPGMASGTLSVILEGRLAGVWVGELQSYVTQLVGNQRRCVRINLCGVSFIDAEGKALLARLWREGVELQGSGCLTRCVVEEITRVGQTEQPRQNRERQSLPTAPRGHEK